MKTMSARDAKNGFGRLIDLARAEPVTIEKHGRGVVVVVSVEEYARLSSGPPHEGGGPIQAFSRAPEEPTPAE